MVRLFWCSRTENYQNFRNVLKDGPRFAAAISERKMFLPFAIFTSSKPYSNVDANHVSFSRRCANGTRQSRSKFFIGDSAWSSYALRRHVRKHQPPDDQSIPAFARVGQQGISKMQNWGKILKLQHLLRNF